MSKFFKIIFYNIFVLLVFILTIEIFFGYWFKEFNFGPDMRGKRIQKIVFQHENKQINYYRDFYGFREGPYINKKYDPSKIKIIFNGGSTGDEMFLDYDQTIVGKLNSYLKKDELDIKIYNASQAGKSLVGHVNEFSSWFKNIPNFKPEVIIYYLGINDRKIVPNRWHNYEANLSYFQNFFWNITQKSFFWEKIKIIKDKYFYSEDNISAYLTNDPDLLQKLKSNEFISFDYAKKNYKIENDKDLAIIKNFKSNLENLKQQLEIWKIQPIFITQITYNINGDKMLHLLNTELKKFSLKYNYTIIKLDEIINMPLNNSFIDNIHTNKNGSEKIAKMVYPHLKPALIKKTISKK